MVSPEFAAIEDLPPALLGACAGFFIGFLVWPDRSSRNAQDPPGLVSEEPREPRIPRSTATRRTAFWSLFVLAPLVLTATLLLAIELVLRSAEVRFDPPSVTPLTPTEEELVGIYWDLSPEPGITLTLIGDGSFVEEHSGREGCFGGHWPDQVCSGTWVLKDG